MIEQHEDHNQTLVDNELKLAVLLRAVPEELRVSICSVPASYDTYVKVKATLTNLVLGKRMYHTATKEKTPNYY